jgi:hypothetical protein
MSALCLLTSLLLPVPYWDSSPLASYEQARVRMSLPTSPLCMTYVELLATIMQDTYAGFMGHFYVGFLRAT